ncbi:DUF4136 domain-containing protein [Algoriphagus sp. PAP.12]|uniref:DUF4136 domain-containing protein n=1 Tax=Algoriphagus sp. PAP.12 TaxID=2996678 RepID=UPI00227B75A4|nr:DUF4136 domain-containing protein [Algoriphagus sp. PAP.12]
MNKFTLPFLFFASLILFSCSSIEIFKENTEIPAAKPYNSFVIINQEVNMRGFSAQYLDERVQEKLKAYLESQGMVYDKMEPDLVIRYTSNEDQRQREVNNYNNPYPYWGYRVWDPFMYNPYMNNYGRRTDNYELLQVIVDFIDPKKDKFLMTLTGVTEVSSPKSKEKKVLKATEKILERFSSELNTSQ